VKASGLLNPTTGTAIPARDDASAGWEAFLGQSGQLEKANDDKAGAQALNEECHQLQIEALAKATKPWWKIW